MTENVFVTCIYDGLHGTKFGGRNNRLSRYVNSLQCIAKTQIPIFCFTSSNLITKLQKEFAHLKNVTFKVFELTDYIHHKKIQELKNKIVSNDQFYTQRCFEIMWGKFYFLDQVQKEIESKNIFWIDAGLSHPDVVSPKYTDAEFLKKHIYENNYKLFTPDFVTKLSEYVGDKVFFIACTQAHSPGIPEKYNNNPYTSKNGVTGGLFGGNYKKMQKIINDFNNKLKKILDDNLLYGEENILTGVYCDNQDISKIFIFDSWYHEGWGDWHNPNQKNYSNFFDLLNLDLPKPIENKITFDEREIVFCSLIIGEKYRNISKKLIESLNKFCPNNKLVVITDDVNFYNSYNNVIPFSYAENYYSTFNYNNKRLAIEKSFELGYKKIIYLDADCWVNDLKIDMFNCLQEGITANYSIESVDYIINPSIREKVINVKNRFNNKHVYIFKEQCMIFNITEQEKYKKFFALWAEISKFINSKKLTHCAECTDIGAAAELCGINMNTIDYIKEIKPHIFSLVLNSPSQALS